MRFFITLSEKLSAIKNNGTYNELVKLYSKVPERRCPLCNGANKHFYFIHKHTGASHVKCKDCGMVFIDKPIPSDIVYDNLQAQNDTWGKIAEGYKPLKIKPSTMPDNIRLIKEIMPEAKTWLEVGCGMGRFLDTARYYFSEVSGIELKRLIGFIKI